MTIISTAQAHILLTTKEQILDVTRTLVRFRFMLSNSISGLKEEQEGLETDAEASLRSDVECALADSFDPLLRTLLAAAGGPQARALEAALDLDNFRVRIETLRESIPVSPEEEAMLEGRIPADVPTEMRMTLNAILADQFDLALDNLLHAGTYKPPQAQEP